MPEFLCQQSYPQTQIFGKPTANSIPAFTFFLLLVSLLPLSLPHVVVFKSKVKQGLSEAVESFATSTEVQETECGQKPEMKP